jgi:hypothetical protein
MTTNFGVWNKRGGHHVIKLDQCSLLYSKYQLSILAILDTKLNLALTFKAADYVRFDWSLINNLNVNIYCTFCTVHPETVEHLFIVFPVIRVLSNDVKIKLGIGNAAYHYLDEWNHIYASTGCNQVMKKLSTVVLKSFIMAVWTERNVKVFDPVKSKTSSLLMQWILQLIKRDLSLLRFPFDPGILLSFST